MAITQERCNSWILELMGMATHQPADVYKIALYLNATATLNKSTTVYTTTGEIVGTGYSAGGIALGTLTIGQTGDSAYWSFPDPVWAAPTTLTADGALIYNSSRANKAVAAILFANAPVVSTAGAFTIDLPAAGAAALLRIT